MMMPLRPSSPAGSHRLVILSLAALALAFAWFCMAAISRDDPWYRNTDMNIHNMVDALAINSDLSPNPFAQPGVPLKYLLALDYRVRHEFGVLPVWNMRKFGQSPDPLREIPRLIQIQRVHSRILVMALILAAAGLVHAITRQVDSACLTIILLCGSSGLLFHGLLSRPELLCVGFGNVLALLCAWRATSLSPGMGKYTWLFVAGLLCGLAMLEKLPGICYLAVCCGWCWLSAWVARPDSPGELPAGKADFWYGCLPAVAAGMVFWLLFALGRFHDALGPVVLLRLRLAAAIIGLLPLLALWPVRSPLGRFLVVRVRELALLGGGALVAFPLIYGLLRGVMSEPQAANYMTGVLHFLVNPAPYMETLASAEPTLTREFSRFLMEAPVLFAGAFVLTIALCLARSVPRQLKALAGLLLVTGMGMALLLSKRHFYAQYGIFPQVPLVLACTLSLYGLSLRRATGDPAGGPHWTAPLVITVAFLLMFQAWFDTRFKYNFYQDDANLPVSPLTLTFIFDHDAHIPAYRQIMRDRYGTREEFARILDQYLADPANRH